MTKATSSTDAPRGYEDCKAALCAEICRSMGFEPSNLAFSPGFTPAAEAELDRLCSGACDECPILDAATAMREDRIAREKMQ